jgi:hypothetical protein
MLKIIWKLSQINNSRIECMYPIKFIFVIILLFLFSPLCEAKKRCKPLLEKLQNIQAMQRNGYSSKRGTSLRAREDKARDNWWQCEQGRGKKTKSKDKKKRDSRTANYLTKVKSTKNKRAKSKKIKAGNPFKTSNAIVIKSKYQGIKKRAWLAFYQQPTRCQRPKSLAEFAFCSEDKQIQRAAFEQIYTE